MIVSKVYKVVSGYDLDDVLFHSSDYRLAKARKERFERTNPSKEYKMLRVTVREMTEPLSTMGG